MPAAGTKDDPWVLKTPPRSSEYTMYRDDDRDPPAIVCQVGKTTLLYHARDRRPARDAHGPRRLDRARQRRRGQAGEGGNRRGLGPLAVKPRRWLLRAQEGSARTLRHEHAAAVG